MTRIIDSFAGGRRDVSFICDFSPPRGANPAPLEFATNLDADFISVSYNPGRSVRVNSALAAHWIRSVTGKEVVFTLATRDMNRLAIQSLLLGASLLGLENVIVLRGDSFSPREAVLASEVNDYRPTELIHDVAQMNQGFDFKGRRLRAPTDFCVGATIDLGRNMEREVALTRRKVLAGAQFFISQLAFDAVLPTAFLARYAERYGEELAQPIFHGVQVMTQGGVTFGSVPAWVTNDLEKGRSGEDIARQVVGELSDRGFRSIYLVPPIMKGGRRDYEAARAVIEAFRRGSVSR